MATTMLQNLVNPEVMAGMISATLPKKIKFSTIARIDTTLTGIAGDTITVPKYAYIGDAEDVAEGVAMGTTKMVITTTKVTVKKAGKAVELTDEAVLSGYGDPMGQATNQLGMSIASKIDNDVYDALCGAKLVYDGTGTAFGYDAVVNADALFGDESDNALNKILYIHPAMEIALRKDANFIDRNKFGGDVMASGVIGRIAGAMVRKSKRVKLVKYAKAEGGSITIVADGAEENETQKHLATIQANCIDDLKVGNTVNTVAVPYYACPLIVTDVADPNEAPEADSGANEDYAVTIYMKRAAQLETDRDILAKTTVISADEHYGVALSNDSKVVLAKFKA